MTGRAISELLDDARRSPPIPNASQLLGDLRCELERAATEAAAGLPDERLPLRLTKDRIGKVLACQRHLVATATHPALSEPVVRGRILDRLLHHHVHGDGAAARGPALAIAEGAFEAERDDDVLAWLDEHRDGRQRLAEDATSFAAHLATMGPIEPSWWPRCESRVRVDLADGRVVCAAQLDLVVGGNPTPHPMVVLEAKSGRFGQDHRDGLFWYALLAALRHDAPPAAVVAWSGRDGASWCQPVTEHVLAAATDRGVTALRRLGDLARGGVPTATPCRACAWCPDRDACEVKDVTEGSDDGW